MKKYFDDTGNRLVFIEESASPDYWDNHWDKGNFKERIEHGKHNKFMLKNTRRFLKNGIILEGGCGFGGNVYCLQNNGYSAFGVDFARNTVKKIHKYFPELNVLIGDVRDLHFKDDVFDGYWSLGVIEHFSDGYDSIVKEMKRVLKTGGYAFLSFPYMSPLRRIKVNLKLYRKHKENINVSRFYQFALDSAAVKKDFRRHGFKFEYSMAHDGLKGFKDEIFLFRFILQRLYNYEGKRVFIYRIRNVLARLLSKFSGHMILMVFKKNEILCNQ